MRRTRALAFTLIEVAISLAILAVVLTGLLEVQASSLNKAGRARDLTIATMLARSKMIDIEKELFDEGFTMGEVKEEGDFEEEGHSRYKWAYTITELELDLSNLLSMCGAFGDSEEGSAVDCESTLGGFGGPLESLTGELGRSLRLVELNVTWAVGKFKESMTIRAIMTREDYGLQPVDALPNLGGP